MNEDDEELELLPPDKKPVCKCIGNIHMRFLTTVRDDKRVVRLDLKKIIERTRTWSR
jgi:hypothetical protein